MALRAHISMRIVVTVVKIDGLYMDRTALL